MPLSQKLYRKAFHMASDFQYLSQRICQTKSRCNFAPIALSDLNIVEALKADGACVTSLSDLNLDTSPQFQAAAMAIASQLPASDETAAQGFRIHAPSSQLLQHPDVFLWGLEERLLTIVEHYLNAPVFYCGAVIRRDLANDVVKGTRLWHRDIEDRRMCKIIVYLNDVTSRTGAFEYIPAQTHSRGRSPFPRYGYISNEEIDQYVSTDASKLCVGEAGTVIFCDTATVFHRGRVPVERDRLAIFFTYVSRRPRSPWKCRYTLTRSELAELIKPLSLQQQQCIFWRGAAQKTRTQTTSVAIATS